MNEHPLRDTPPRWLAAAPVLFVLLWATGFIGAGLSMPHSEPFSFLTARFGAVVPLMALLAVLLSWLPVLSVDRIHGDKDPERFGLSNALALVLIALFQRDYPIEKRACSTKVLFFTVCAFAYLVFSCYTAILTSTMISKPTEVMLSSLTELVDGGYSIVVWKNTATHALFRDSPPGTEYNYVWENLIKDNPWSVGGIVYLL